MLEELIIENPKSIHSCQVQHNLQMRSFATIAGDGREIAIVLLESIDDSIDNLVVLVGCVMEVGRVPLWFFVMEFVPEIFPIAHCLFE